MPREHRLGSLSRTFFFALAVALSVIGLCATSALAFTWRVEEWKLGPPPVELLVAGESETVEAELTAGTEVSLESEVGATPLEIKATGVKLVAGAKIEQGAANALDEGKFEFTGATVSHPSNCAVKEGKIVWNNLKSEVVSRPRRSMTSSSPPAVAPWRR
jgi:hypothetical protein